MEIEDGIDKGLISANSWTIGTKFGMLTDMKNTRVRWSSK